MLNKTRILFSYGMLLAVFGVFYLDLAGISQFSDIPFLLGVISYMIFMLLQKSSSKPTFFVCFILLIFMGLSFIITGSGRITERMGEWFYIFFLFGLVQYTAESYNRNIHD